MQKNEKPKGITAVLERRDVVILLSGVLFIINFMLFYFIWIYAFPEMTGFKRLLFCWVGAYAFTWFINRMTKGLERLILTLILLVVQYLVFHYRP